jgi:ArsR family transcriptional regulator
MNSESTKPLEAKSEIFKALGHPARLTIIISLGDGERCVCELQEQVGSDMSTVSKHLTILRSAGLVSSEKRGKQVFYSLEMPCALGFIECVDNALKKQGF